MRVKTVIVVLLPVLFLLCSCATHQLTGLQRQSLETVYIDGEYKTIFRSVRTVFQNEGYSVEQSDLESGFIQFIGHIPEKNPKTAAALGILPGGGSFYVRSYGIGLVDLLLWPFSIIWDPLIAASKARHMKKEVKASVTLTEMGQQTEIRTGFYGIDSSKVSEYGIMLKRVYADVRKQTMMREGKSVNYEGTGKAPIFTKP
jgi:hypothetical protein